MTLERALGFSRLPALSTARATARYLPRGRRCLRVRLQRLVPLARRRTGRLQLRVFVSFPFLWTNWQPLFLIRATETSTRTTLPFRLPQVRSEAVPFRRIRPWRSRLSPRVLRRDRGAVVSRHAALPRVPAKDRVRLHPASVTFSGPSDCALTLTEQSTRARWTSTVTAPTFVAFRSRTFATGVFGAAPYVFAWLL